jgi:flagellar biosynthesis/type III secretory pathway chaperone
LRQLIAECDNHADLSVCFAHLVLLAQRCHESNRDNGRLILERQKQTRGALNIIRQTENSPSTYSGQGKATEQGSSRSLGKA